MCDFQETKVLIDTNCIENRYLVFSKKRGGFYYFWCALKLFVPAVVKLEGPKQSVGSDEQNSLFIGWTSPVAVRGASWTSPVAVRGANISQTLPVAVYNLFLCRQLMPSYLYTLSIYNRIRTNCYFWYTFYASFTVFLKISVSLYCHEQMNSCCQYCTSICMCKQLYTKGSNWRAGQCFIKDDNININKHDQFNNFKYSRSLENY